MNAGLRQLRARPPEFLILGLQPEPWDPVDSLAWTIMMAWDLGGNWSQELLRLRLALKMPLERLNELLPPYPGDKPLLTTDYGERLRSWQLAEALDGPGLDRLARAAPPSGLEGIGSNNWAVSGKRSETGAPLLANDPHLKLSAPSLWYLARLQAPGLEVAGATIPGLPAVILGQNRQVAWGFTNTAPDVQDLYLERVNPDDTAQYLTPTGWADFETRRETIRVRGGDPVTITVRRSRHGPVISDLNSIASGLPTIEGHQPVHVLALRWTALDPDPGSLVASLRLQRVRSVGEFIEAAHQHVAPMQNMLVADRNGRIAFVAAGRVPLRSPDHDLKGLVPAPGWEPKYDWVGFLDADKTPREIDPPRGWLATANQRIHGPEYPHFITSEWAAPWRQARIEAMLQAQPQHSVDSLAAMQSDTVSLATLKLLPVLRRAGGGARAGGGGAARARRLRRRHACRTRRAADLLGLGAPAHAWHLRRRGRPEPVRPQFRRPQLPRCAGGRGRTQRCLVVRRQVDTGDRGDLCRPERGGARPRARRARRPTRPRRRALALGRRAPGAFRAPAVQPGGRCSRSSSSCARRSAATPTPSTSRGSGCGRTHAPASSTWTSTARRCAPSTTSPTPRARG